MESYYNISSSKFNTTSILQPIDQGKLEVLKRRYKKNLLWHVCNDNSSLTLSFPENVKKITIKDAVYQCAQAAEETGLDSLGRDCNKLLLPQVDSLFGNNTVGSEEAIDPEPSDDTGDREECFQ